MVRLMATVIPIVEVAIGALLLLGLATRWVLAVGVALVCLLIFGSALRRPGAGEGPEFTAIRIGPRGLVSFARHAAEHDATSLLFRQLG